MSFLSRLAEAPEEPAMDAVARNLENVLSAKRGYAGAVEVFGVGNYDAYRVDQALVDALTRELTEQVRRHEPRLKEPKIALRGRAEGLWVSFELRGRLDQQTVTFEVLFHSVFRYVRVARGAPP